MKKIQGPQDAFALRLQEYRKHVDHCTTCQVARDLAPNFSSAQRVPGCDAGELQLSELVHLSGQVAGVQR